MLSSDAGVDGLFAREYSRLEGGDLLCYYSLLAVCCLLLAACCLLLVACCCLLLIAACLPRVACRVSLVVGCLLCCRCCLWMSDHTSYFRHSD